MTFSLSRARMEKILGAGSGRAVALLSLRLGTSVSAALGGKDREDADTWHTQISSVGQPDGTDGVELGVVGVGLSWWLCSGRGSSCVLFWSVCGSLS